MRPIVGGYKHPQAVSRTIKLVLIAVIAGVMIVRSTPWFAQAQSLPTDPSPTCTVTPGLFARWFQSGSVSLNIS